MSNTERKTATGWARERGRLLAVLAVLPAVVDGDSRIMIGVSTDQPTET